MFQYLWHYLNRAELILYFVAASRSGDLHLHLQAGYIADIHVLKTEHPETWRELESGNISVTKSAIPFVSIGADHACEQIHCLLKVNGGITATERNSKDADMTFFSLQKRTSLF